MSKKQFASESVGFTFESVGFTCKLADCECLQDCENCKAMKQSVDISWGKIFFDSNINTMNLITKNNRRQKNAEESKRYLD